MMNGIKTEGMQDQVLFFAKNLKFLFFWTPGCFWPLTIDCGTHHCLLLEMQWGLLSKAVYHTNISSITGYSSNGRCIDAVHGYNQLCQ